MNLEGRLYEHSEKGAGPPGRAGFWFWGLGPRGERYFSGTCGRDADEGASQDSGLI